jgi:hypothetical protein
VRILKRKGKSLRSSIPLQNNEYANAFRLSTSDIMTRVQLSLHFQPKSPQKTLVSFGSLL